MPFEMIRNDITRMDTDAIVNAANSRLQAGGGVCGAIFARAGMKKLQAACDAIGFCKPGEAVITPGFDLPARFVIHTPGPVWQGGMYDEEKTLRGCYINSMKLAAENGLSSIAFPLISAGIFGYPRKEALSVAVSAICEGLMRWDLKVYLVLFDNSSFLLGEKLHADIQAYIDDNYIEKQPVRRNRRIEIADQMKATQAFSAPVMHEEAFTALNLDEALEQVEEGFNLFLLNAIDKRGLTDPQVYKRANIDRKLFSKIRSNPDYRPGKNTVIALCVALEMDMDESRDLLSRAGYAFSRSSKADIIVEFFIENRKWDVLEINKALFDYNLPLLGSQS